MEKIQGKIIFLTFVAFYFRAKVTSINFRYICVISVFIDADRQKIQKNFTIIINKIKDTYTYQFT
jgi:hypothetical protein